MADVHVENQEINELTKSQTIDISSSQIQDISPTKAQPDQTNQKLEENEKKEVENNEYEEGVEENYEEQGVEENYGEQEEQEYHEEPPARNSVEVTKELSELHVIADRCLGLYKPDAPGPYSYYVQNPHESYAYEKSVRSNFSSPIKGEDRELIDYRPSHVEYEVRSSFRPTEHELRYSSPQRVNQRQHQYQYESPDRHHPRYDKEKLDQIINRILSSPESAQTLKYLNKGYNNRNNEITLNRNYNQEAPLQSRSKEVKTKNANAGLKQRGHFCGAVENDLDSLVDLHMEDSAKQIKNKQQELTNFYVGSIVEDEDEVPRTKRIGKRQQIIASKKPSSLLGSAEFVRKGAYEQKNREQGKNIEAHKYFDTNEAQIQDYDFSSR